MGSAKVKKTSKSAAATKAKAKAAPATKAKTRAAPARKNAEAVLPKRPSAPDENAPPPPEPTWMKHARVQELEFRVKLHIRMPDGSVADDDKAASLAMWPSVRLRMVFDPLFGWYRSRDTPWHKAAIATAMKLAALAKPAWMLENITDRWNVPVLDPVAFSKEKAEALVTRTVFLDGDGHTPWTELRSGDAFSVQYERSLVVRHDSVTLHLPPTEQNAALLEETLDQLVGGVSFAYAGVGYGYAGWSSVLAIDRGVKTMTRLEHYRRTKLDKLESTSATMGADWLLWIGDRWREPPQRVRAVAPLLEGAARTVEQKGGLTRITVPRPASLDDADGAKAAKAMAADLANVIKKLHAQHMREAMRR